MDDEVDVAKIPALFNGYDPALFAREELGYKPNGLIGAADYNAYKAAMERIRDERKRRRSLISEKEKLLIRARQKLWTAGKRLSEKNSKQSKNSMRMSSFSLVWIGSRLMHSLSTTLGDGQKREQEHQTSTRVLHKMSLWLSFTIPQARVGPRRDGRLLLPLLMANVLRTTFLLLMCGMAWTLLPEVYARATVRPFPPL